MSFQPLRVAEVEQLSPLVKRIRFEHPHQETLPVFSAGAHLIVEMKDGSTLRRNPYSLISDPNDGSGYEIAVRLEKAGRGGSAFLHRHVQVGDTLRVGTPVNLFSLDLRARKHVLIAGGIGITPFLSQLHLIRQLQLPFELHYAAKTRKEAAGLKLLPKSQHVHLHISDEGTRMNLEQILKGQPLGTHIYTCGPQGLIDAVAEMAVSLGCSKEALHFEEFLSPPAGKAFSVTLAKSDLTISVRADQSLLEALEEAKVEAPWLCRGGACGQCETRVVSCTGTIEHHDHWLSPDDKKNATKIMPCVSRFQGSNLTLDR